MREVSGVSEKPNRLGLRRFPDVPASREHTTGIERLDTWLLGHRRAREVFGFVFRVLRDNLIGTAAQTAFFLLLAIFPILMLVAGWLSRMPFAFDTGLLSAIFPESVASTLQEVMEHAPSSTGYTVVQIALSVWSASAGIWALMRGICISHTGRTPNYFKGRIISVLLMVGFVAMIALSLVVWVFGRDIVSYIAGGDWQSGDVVVSVARYAFTLPLLFLFVLVMYAATPGFRLEMRQTAIGAAIAAVSWTLVSRGFEAYMSTFSRYSALYGGVGAFLGLAVWLLVVCFVIMFGAEVNAYIAETAALRAALTTELRPPDKA